jgi:hypothetical protein
MAFAPRNTFCYSSDETTVVTTPNPKKSTFTHFTPLSHTIERRPNSVKSPIQRKSLIWRGFSGNKEGKPSVGTELFRDKRRNNKDMLMQLNVEHEVCGGVFQKRRKILLREKIGVGL